MAHLPEVQRMVLSLRFFEGLPVEDIATMLQQPVNTIKSDRRRALQRLRELLTQQGVQAEDLVLL
jgi:RNA polymerase sigma factor (sigma-70 family)